MARSLSLFSFLVATRGPGKSWLLTTRALEKFRKMKVVGQSMKSSYTRIFGKNIFQQTLQKTRQFPIYWENRDCPGELSERSGKCLPARAKTDKLDLISLA